MSNDIRKIRLQLNKIKKLIQEEKDRDKRAINKLSRQLKEINAYVSKLSKMANRIKGGKIRGLGGKKKGGAKNCPFIVEEEYVAGKKRKKRRKRKSY